MREMSLWESERSFDLQYFQYKNSEYKITCLIDVSHFPFIYIENGSLVVLRAKLFLRILIIQFEYLKAKAKIL